MKSYGIDGSLLTWFKHYLYTRKQRVALNESSSSICNEILHEQRRKRRLQMFHNIQHNNAPDILPNWALPSKALVNIP